MNSVKVMSIVFAFFGTASTLAVDYTLKPGDVKIDNKELGMKVFASVRALAQYIHEKRTDTVH